jgi:tRNA U34 5-carboxymethylaminomethyl modifying GTPase MnmE/TrmE
MENKFIRYRKINVFGSENAGKQTLINSLDINNSYIEYEIDDENSEIITRIICSYSNEENMYFNFCIKQLNDEKKLEKYEIENLLYETELILIIINTEKNNFQNEIDLLNNITSFENDKILILFNQTESNNENNNSLKEFKKQYLKYQQIQISLNINEDINKIKQKLHHKLYEQS